MLLFFSQSNLQSGGKSNILILVPSATVTVRFLMQNVNEADSFFFIPAARHEKKEFWLIFRISDSISETQSDCLSISVPDYERMTSVQKSINIGGTRG